MAAVIDFIPISARIVRVSLAARPGEMTAIVTDGTDRDQEVVSPLV
jgi:hypothetical protein